MFINKWRSGAVLLFSVASLLLVGCSSSQGYANRAAYEEYIFIDQNSSLQEITNDLYSPVLIEHALTLDKAKLISSDNKDGIPEKISMWINNLNESDDVKVMLRRFASSVQDAILVDDNMSQSIKGPIMYDLVQAGYNVMLYKGMDEGRKLLDEISSQLCDTRAKTIKYMLFLQDFEPADTYASQL